MPALTVVNLALPGKIQRKYSNATCHLLTGFCCFRKQSTADWGSECMARRSRIPNYRAAGWITNMTLSTLPTPSNWQHHCHLVHILRLPKISHISHLSRVKPALSVSVMFVYTMLRHCCKSVRCPGE